jgi:hypothetical protein
MQLSPAYYESLVPTRQRGNAVCTAPAVLDGILASAATSKRWTLARPLCIPTPARGNEKREKKELHPGKTKAKAKDAVTVSRLVPDTVGAT